MYPDFKNYDEYNHYVLSYASNQDVAELEKKIDDIQESGDTGGSDIPLVDGKIPAEYLPSNLVTTGDDGTIPENALPTNVVKVGDDGLISSDILPSYVDDVIEVESLPETGESGKIYINTTDNKQYRWSGSQFVEITSGGVVIGDVTGTAYDGGKGTALETKVTDLEAIVSDKLGVDDVAVWAKSEDPTTIPLEKMDENIVEYSDFSYVPSGETEPVSRKTIQLANYDSISGLNTEGNDAANLIMMSKWNKVDIGSSRYPVNLNGSEFTLNDEKVIATTDQIPDVSDFVTKEEVPSVFETVGLTNLETGESSSNIQSAIGTTFEEFIDIIQSEKTVIIDRTSVGDYKACIHASGNISSGNGAANLMFFVGTVPTIYQVQYVNGTWALAVDKYEFAEKSDIPSVTNLATKEEVSTATANLVPNTRTVAGKALDSDITIASSDLTDGNKLALVYEMNGLTNLQEGAGEDEIKAALGVEFEELLTIIQEDKTVIIDRNNVGDYKVCIHATGNISSGNGGANLMFFIGYKPTIFQIQYVSGTYALAVIQSEFAEKDEIPSLDGYATTQNVSDSIAAEASARDKAIETATSDLVHNTLTVAGKSLTENITLVSTDLTDGDDLAKAKDVSNLDAKVFGDLDVSKFENASLTCQVVKLDSSYTGDLGLPENINGQPYNEETNNINPALDYLVCGYFDEGFVFHYDAWDSLHSSAIFKTIISALGLTNTSVDNKVAKTTRIAGHELNTDVELASADLTDGDELVKKDEILDTVVDESRNDTLAQKLVVRTYLPVQRNTDVTNKPEAEIFSEYFNASVTDRISLRTYLQSNMAYISYNFILSGNCTFYKLPIIMADIPSTGDIKIVAMGPDLNNGNLLTKFTFTITLNGDASSVHIEKKALES